MQVPTTQAEEEAKAKARLELIRTQAVGIVDKAANGEVFLALKSAGMEGQNEAAPAVDTTKAPDAPPAPQAALPAPPAVRMPGAAKAAMTEALGKALDECSKLAEMLSAAEVDDAAPMPPELIQMAMAIEDSIGAMVEPYEEAMMAAPAPPPAPAPAGDPAQKAAPVAEAPAAMKPPRPRMAMKRLAAMADVHKALSESCQKIGEHIAWARGAAGMPAPAQKGMQPATKAEIDPYTAMSATADAVRERMRCLREMLENDPAQVANELRQIIPMVDNLAMLVTQARSGALAAPVPGAPAAPAAPPAEAQMVAQKAFLDEAKATVTAMKADLLAALKAEVSPLVLSAQTAAARAQGALTKVEKSVMAPQGAPPGESSAAPTMPLPADPWRVATTEINEHSQARRKTGAGK